LNDSVYNKFAPQLMERGYFPLPIAPGSKAPHRYIPSKNKFELFVGWNERPDPITTPQPGAGIGVRLGRGVVALDYDNEEAALRVSEIMGGSPVNKAGVMAWTEFYRTGSGVASEDFVDENGELMLQVLSDGRQTVIPPSIHPDSGEPYRWTNGASLYDTKPDQLPELPADYRERIMALGYCPGGKKKTKPESTVHEARATYDQDGPHADLNKVALKNLAAWVPQLSLYKCRRRVGRFASYEAVATWRPSMTGRPLEVRKLNLKISPLGIKDFGDSRGYSPLDLVMVARPCSLSDAMTWLEERVRPYTGPEVDFEALGHQGERPKEKGPADAPEGERNANGDPVPPASLGKAWHFGDPIPAQQPMLVPDLLPLKGFGYLGGQWGTFKTFITNDLSVAIASQGKVAGRQVAVRAAVILIELEASNTEIRLHAAAAARKVEDTKLPIVQLRAEPPTIMNDRKRNPAWPKWSAALAQYARAFAASRGVPLGAIILDPQNSIAGFQDEQSSSEGQVVSNAMWTLSRQADCLVLVTDHLGKNVDAGLRGTSAKETNPLFILSTGATKKDTYAARQLEIRKMRNGRAGIAVSFSMRDWEVTLNQIAEGGQLEPHTNKTLVVEWSSEFDPVIASDEGRASEVSAQQRRALMVLNEMINSRGTGLPPECEAPKGLRGVKLDSWRARLVDKTVLEGKNVSAAFAQVKNALLDRREIDISHGHVWVPLP
jgi:hypothetical protein